MVHFHQARLNQRYDDLAQNLRTRMDELHRDDPMDAASNGLAAVEADAFLSEISLGLAGWEELNLSACLIDYAVKSGLPESQDDFDAVRTRAKSNYSTPAEKKAVIRKALDMLLAEYNKPNVYAPNKAVVQKAKNALDWQKDVL